MILLQTGLSTAVLSRWIFMLVVWIRTWNIGNLVPYSSWDFVMSQDMYVVAIRMCSVVVQETTAVVIG